MVNVRNKLEEIYDLIDELRSASSMASRFANAKKLKETIDILIKELIQEENKLLSEGLKKK